MYVYSSTVVQYAIAQRSISNTLSILQKKCTHRLAYPVASPLNVIPDSESVGLSHSIRNISHRRRHSPLTFDISSCCLHLLTNSARTATILACSDLWSTQSIRHHDPLPPRAKNVAWLHGYVTSHTVQQHLSIGYKFITIHTHLTVTPLGGVCEFGRIEINRTGTEGLSMHKQLGQLEHTRPGPVAVDTRCSSRNRPGTAGTPKK